MAPHRSAIRAPDRAEALTAIACHIDHDVRARGRGTAPEPIHPARDKVQRSSEIDDRS